MYIIFIDREEFNPASYNAVEVHSKSGEPCRFASGDPVVDWAAAAAYIKTNPGEVAFSSTVDYLLREVPGLEWGLDRDGFPVVTRQGTVEHRREQKRLLVIDTLFE